VSSKKKVVLVACLCSASVLLAVSGVLLWGHHATQASRMADSRLEDSSAEVEASLPLFHRVNEGLVRGSQPSRGGAKVLERLGVKTIVDLRSSYDHTDEIGDAAKRLGLGYYWIPMSVWDPPTDEQAKSFVSLVSDQSKGPFFVFCTDGLNRTGMMCAIYRVAHDHWDADTALKEADQLGFSPYYWSLRQYVWTYARKFRPDAVPPEGRAISSLE